MGSKANGTFIEGYLEAYCTGSQIMPYHFVALASENISGHILEH